MLRVVTLFAVCFVALAQGDALLRGPSSADDDMLEASRFAEVQAKKCTAIPSILGEKQDVTFKKRKLCIDETGAVVLNADGALKKIRGKKKATGTVVAGPVENVLKVVTGKTNCGGLSHVACLELTYSGGVIKLAPTPDKLGLKGHGDGTLLGALCSVTGMDCTDTLALQTGYADKWVELQQEKAAHEEELLLERLQGSGFNV